MRDIDDDAPDLGGGEIEFDVLVDGDRRTVRRALTSRGARPVRSWGRAPHRQFAWWDEVRRRPVRLDVVDRLGFGEFRELDLDRRSHVLDAVTIRDGWPRPTPSSEQWLALVHALLDRGRLRRRDIDRLDPWIARPDDDVVAGVLPAPLIERLGAAAEHRQWDTLLACRDDVGNALMGRRRAVTQARRWWRACLQRTTKVQRAVLRPGVRIALLGPDGAGKSSTIDALIGAGVVSSSVYLGVAPASEKRVRSVPGLALSATLRRLVGAWLTASVRRRRGASVALDRHPLEALIGPPTSKRTTIARRWLLAHALPSPEVVVVLMAPAEVLVERKPEHDLAEVTTKRERYLQLARDRGYPVIDTTRPRSDVIAAIQQAMCSPRSEPSAP
ncbi:MAG: hypothetical protein ABIO83_08200 [Ilumatobacteraceae bacterium]